MTMETNRPDCLCVVADRGMFRIAVGSFTDFYRLSFGMNIMLISGALFILFTEYLIFGLKINPL